MQQDRREITNGKWITLDKEQTDFLKILVENNEIKDVIIFGEYLEAIRMQFRKFCNKKEDFLAIFFMVSERNVNNYMELQP